MSTLDKDNDDNNKNDDDGGDDEYTNLYPLLPALSIHILLTFSSPSPSFLPYLTIPLFDFRDDKVQEQQKMQEEHYAKRCAHRFIDCIIGCGKPIKVCHFRRLLTIFYDSTST